jgi:1-acyl-sn-glycerol-3-phosphate acyltransferase
MFLVGYFILPIRAVIGLSSVMSMLIGFSLVRMIPQSALKKLGYKIVGKISSKLVLLTFGYIYVKREVRQVGEYLKDYKSDRILEDKDIPIIVGNHVSFIDIFYMIY